MLRQQLTLALRRAAELLGDDVGGSIHVAVQVDDIIMAVVASAPSVALDVTRCFWATALVLMRLDASLVTSAEKTWILAHDDALRKHAEIMFGELASNAGTSC